MSKGIEKKIATQGRGAGRIPGSKTSGSDVTTFDNTNRPVKSSKLSHSSVVDNIALNFFPRLKHHADSTSIYNILYNIPKSVKFVRNENFFLNELYSLCGAWQHVPHWFSRISVLERIRWNQ